MGEKSIMELKLEYLRKTIEEQQTERYTREIPNIPNYLQSLGGVLVKGGPKYTKVDVGRSGKYMVENETGKIFGIKAYGVIHRGHQYGTLDTVDEWYWGGYTARAKLE